MKPLRPEILLAFLLLLGVAVSGWIYGLHWKRVGTGAEFTEEEKLIIQLQDQIDLLHEENAKLSQRLRELAAEDPGGGGSTPGQ